MTLHRSLFLIAGAFVLASAVLAHAVSPYFLLFTAFVGLNLMQSAFTRWCPMMWVLRRLGVRECETCAVTAEGRTSWPAARS